MKHFVTNVVRSSYEGLPEVHVSMSSGHKWTFRRGLTNKIHLMVGPGSLGKPTQEFPGEWKAARKAAELFLPPYIPG